MNGFIVWDKIAKHFADDICLDAELLQDGISYSLEVKEELFELFYPVGLKDINGKNIYADSSIVEFQLKDDVIFADFTGAKPTIWNEIKMIGYFVFNNEDLRYEIDIVDLEKNKTKSNFVCLYYNIATMSQFKIIDTIQENKLGLIK